MNGDGESKRHLRVVPDHAPLLPLTGIRPHEADIRGHKTEREERVHASADRQAAD
jgi:hypothetical protein